MSDINHHRSSKHKRRHEEGDSKSRSKKHGKHDKDANDRKRHRSEKSKKIRVIDEDDDEGVWCEKNIDMDGEKVSGVQKLSGE